MGIGKKTLNQRNQQDFVATAKKLQCDESEAAFEGKLKRIAKAKPNTKKKPK
jgi:hypothetical protein